MGLISRIGRKLGSIGRTGGKVLSGFGRVGQKLAGGARSIMDTVERIPLIGNAVTKNKVYQGMRGVVSGVEKASKVASKAGQILEATPGHLQGVYQTAGKLKGLGTAGRGKSNDIIGSNVSGRDNTLASVAAGHKQEIANRTNHRASGGVAHGNEAVIGNSSGLFS